MLESIRAEIVHVTIAVRVSARQVGGTYNFWSIGLPDFDDLTFFQSAWFGLAENLHQSVHSEYTILETKLNSGRAFQLGNNYILWF